MSLADFGRFGFDPFREFGFDPFREMRRIQNEMSRIFETMERPTAMEWPPVNLWVGEDNILFTAELPGVKPEDLDLTVRDDLLTLQGRREPPAEAGSVTWHRRERGWGTFSRTVRLPFRVDPEQVQARFTNGILEIALTRPETERPRRIQVQAS
jgi:HSP20 family protein